MLGKLEPKLKTGKERLTFNGQPSPFKLLDVWCWSSSDLMNNTTRGLLAEFIVASAVGATENAIRQEWDAFDVVTTDGIKIEVKSCAFIQTWQQSRFSKIKFGIRSTRKWNHETKKYDEESKRHADVYVFCLLHHQDKLSIDPLNLNQWEFYVLPTRLLNEQMPNKNSITLLSLTGLTKAVNYDELDMEISRKAKQ